jgi:Xaa-Pro dipeptidase
MLAKLVNERDEEKRAKLRRMMQSNGFDALLLRLPEDIVYITGYWPFYGVSYLFYPVDDEPSILAHEGEEEYARKSWVKDVESYRWETLENISSYLDAATTFLRRHLKVGMKVGVEMSDEYLVSTFNRREAWAVGIPTINYLRKRFDGVRFADVIPQLQQLQGIKTRKEIQILKIVNQLADMGMEAFHEAIEVDKTEAEVAGEVEAKVTGEGTGYKGAEKVIVMAFVMSGTNTAKAYRMFNVHTSKRLERGDPVLVELNICADGYWSDVTRVYFVGRPSSTSKTVFDAVLEAQQAAIEVAKEGVHAKEVNDVAFKVLRKRGYGSYIRHRVGHGIGCHLHEGIPALHHASRDVLRAGMVHSVEPGVYIPGKLGVRIEDIVLDQKNKCELLTSYSQT